MILTRKVYAPVGRTCLCCGNPTRLDNGEDYCLRCERKLNAIADEHLQNPSR